MPGWTYGPPRASFTVSVHCGCLSRPDLDLAPLGAALTLSLWQAVETVKLQYHIVHHEPKALPEAYSLELRNLIRLMMTKPREERVTSHKVIELIPAALRRHFSADSERELRPALLPTVLTYGDAVLAPAGIRPLGRAGARKPAKTPLPETAFVPVKIDVKRHQFGNANKQAPPLPLPLKPKEAPAPAT